MPSAYFEDDTHTFMSEIIISVDMMECHIELHVDSDLTFEEDQTLTYFYEEIAYPRLNSVAAAISTRKSSTFLKERGEGTS